MNLAKVTAEYIEGHPSVKDCLKKGLVNYSALARRIAEEHKLDEAASFDAILVACRRFAEQATFSSGFEEKVMAIIRNGKFEVKNKVGVFILDGSVGWGKLLEIVRKIRDRGEGVHVIQGTKTLTVITDEGFAKEMQHRFKPYLIKSRTNLVQVTHKASQKIEDTPGVLHYLSGVFAENGVNIIEAMSAWTDTLFLVEERDAPKVFALLNYRQRAAPQ